MPQLKVYLLGPPQIKIDEISVTIRRSKALALLIYLAGNGRPQRRETLSTMLWPDSKPAQARSSLRRELSILKKQIGVNCFVIERDSLGLNRDTWVDVDQFRQYLRKDSADSLSVTDRLIKGINLYADKFLAGFHLENCAAFDEWQFFQAEELRHQYATGLDRLTGLLEQRGDYEAAVTFAQRRLASDSLHEPAHRDLMRLYVRLGRHAAALRQYDLCCQILANELSIPPTVETSDLYEQIQRGELTSQPNPAKNTLIAEPALRPLPQQSTPFVGRETELRLLNELFVSTDQRLITIVGAGGMGKSRLALAFAEQQLQKSVFADGVTFVPLAPLSAVDHITSALADALAFPLDHDGRKRTAEQQILDYLRQKQMLLVMDNFEHLLEGGQFVAHILDAAPNVHILATSRERLNLHGEQLVNLQGLRFPGERVTADDLGSEYSAVDLFMQTARRLQADVVLSDADEEQLVTLCRLVGGMPLAIELAASWVDSLSLVDICIELQNNLDLLTTDQLNIPERHRSMRAVFAYTWERLNREEQTVLAQCSAFRGGFTRAAIQAVTGAPLSTLSKLTRKSLWHYDRKANRYQMHELLRQYSAERLASRPELDAAVRQKHSNYYIQALSAFERRLKGAQQFAALAELEVELENTRRAFSWRVQLADLELIAETLPTLSLFYELTMRHSDGEQLCQTVLGLVNADSPPLLEVRALTWLSGFLYLQGLPDQARAQLDQALVLLERPTLATVDTRHERAAVLLGLGQLGSLTLDHHDQVKHYEESLALYEDLNDGWGTSKVLTALCWVVRHQVVVHTAEQWQAQLIRGEQLARRSVAICRQTGDQVGEAHALVQVASSVLYQGRDIESLATIDECIDLCTTLGLQGILADALVYRGLSYASSGRYAEARLAIQAAYDVAQKLGYYHQLSNCLRMLGVITFAEGQLLESRRWSLSSVATYRTAENHHYLCIAVAVLGSAECLLGNQDQAIKHLVESLRIVNRIHSYLLLWSVLGLASLVFLKKEDFMRSVEINALNEHFMAGAFLKFNQDLGAKYVVEATGHLPLEDIAAARRRGQRLDLWATVESLLAEFD